MKLTILFTFLLLLMGGCSSSLHRASTTPYPKFIPTAQKGDTREYRLDNGMKVILKIDRRSPLAVSQVWYRVGSVDEHSGITGISHMLEHMMFKGTERISREAFTKSIHRVGGENNAFTARDYTVYYQQLSNRWLPLSFQLEADRMVNLVLREENLVKERKVVKEERRLRISDNPFSLAHEQLYATAFNEDGYRWPIIGWMGDISQYSLEDLRMWYERWYNPQNSILVVVGDIDFENTLLQMQNEFAHLPSRDQGKHRKKPGESTQKGERQAVVYGRTSAPYLLYGFETPFHSENYYDNWEPYALYGLAFVLGGSNSARLVDDLIYSRSLAISVHASYDPYTRHADLFTIGIMANQGTSIHDLQEAVNKHIRRLKEKLISKEELLTLKAQILSSRTYQLDSLFYQAYQLGKMEMVSAGWQEVYRLEERLELITPQRIREVARKYLNKDTQTSVILYPHAKELDEREDG